MIRKRSLSIFVALAAGAVAAQQTGVFALLDSAARIGRQPGGEYLLPTNQLLRPWGQINPFPGRPVDVTVDADRKFVAILDARLVSVLEATSGTKVGEIKSKATSYTGIAFRPGTRELWFSETSRNGPDTIAVATLDEKGAAVQVARIDLAGHAVPAGLAFSADGKTLYAALSRNNSLGVFDASERKLTREVPAGVAPFAVAVDNKRQRIFVTNRGGSRPGAGDSKGPSSGTEVATVPTTGGARRGTLSVIDAKTFQVKEVETGLAPAAAVLSPDASKLAILNGHSDSVSFFDPKSLKRADVRIPTWPESAAGSQPIAAVFAPDGNTLYVATGGNNAITVLTKSGNNWKIAGAVPTGWFPSGVTLDAKNDLRVVCVKGTGNTASKKGNFNTLQFEGLIETIPAPLPAQLEAGMREVRAANEPRYAPGGGIENLQSLGIEHVVLIIKENRTYDQVFGDIPKGNGDPKLVMYGRDITPNHHALAEKYVLLDNFHTGGAISFDGHQWLMQGFVSDYVERAFAASPRGYAWNMADALTIAPVGFFWQGTKKPLDVRVYGEFCEGGRYDPVTKNVTDMDEKEELSWTEYWNLYKQQRWQPAVGCSAGVPALRPIMSKSYPHNSSYIPDQIRAEEYLRELGEMEKSGRMPQLSVMTLSTDHTNGTRPGSPTPRAMVADDDLALGRIVEGLSKSRFWSKTLILVTEDDAQNGFDHVDGHRTVALAIGPMVRRAAVDSNYYNHGSMIRTIQDLFQITPRTRFYAQARAMRTLFTAEKDTSAYATLQPKVQLDEMNPPLKALSGRKLWAARQSAAMNWSEPDDVPEKTLNAILWWDAKGYATPLPRRAP